MLANGRTSITLEEILSRMSEADILAYYLNIYEIPTIINSPLRQDKRPSFGLYSIDGKRIHYTDLSTKDRGGLFDLLGKMWNCSYIEVLERINNDIIIKSNVNMKTYTPTIIRHSNYNTNSDLQCKIREWRDYDLEYWGSYGITLDWLKYCDVFPVSHKIILKDNKRYVFKADKYCYAYVERKEGHITIKLYSPFNRNGYKWQNKHDGSVISLWTKIPAKGDVVCICSSVKDALCLSCNTKIPTLSIQGEGYSMSKTAIENLKERFKKVFVLLDNDNVGLFDGKKLSEETGFTNLVLPQFEGGKDISDAYKVLGKDKWLDMMRSVFTPYGVEFKI